MKPDVLHESAKQVLDRLQSHLIRVESVQAWPGTQLAGSRTVERHLFHLDPDSLTVLVSSAVGPFDWVNPMLPEDLHFLREDDSVLLGTIAQEEESWLELTSAEYQDISLGLPSGVRLQAQV